MPVETMPVETKPLETKPLETKPLETEATGQRDPFQHALHHTFHRHTFHRPRATYWGFSFSMLLGVGLLTNPGTALGESSQKGGLPPAAGGQVIQVLSEGGSRTQNEEDSGGSRSASLAASGIDGSRGNSGGGDTIGMLRAHADFKVPAGLEGKVEFWKLIFTKYGQQQFVFHHRDYPEIIYSVLDTSALALAASGGGGPTPKTGELVEDEIKRIRGALLNLAEGNKPKDPFERRMKRLFVGLEGRFGTKVYNTAAEQEKIRYQPGIREKFIESIKRSGRYLHAMEKVFEERGLPVELTRVPFIESSFDYTAYSSVGAAGIWQFMRGTGKKYLRINASVDERRDPIAATYAAAEYLRSAYGRLESWPLAVTSYNHGVGGMMRGVQEVGSRHLPDLIDRYSSASFGFASKNFYAEFLAALQIERNYQRYFPGLERETPWYFEEVLPGKSLTLAELMKYAECSREDVERLNRSLLSPIMNGKGRIPSDMVLRLPAGAGKRLQAHLRGSAVVGIVEPPKPRPEPERSSRRGRGKKSSHTVEVSAEKPASKKGKSQKQKSGGADTGAEKQQASKKTAKAPTSHTHKKKGKR